MFCLNCGNYIGPNETKCLQCGAITGQIAAGECETFEEQNKKLDAKIMRDSMHMKRLKALSCCMIPIAIAFSASTYIFDILSITYKYKPETSYNLSELMNLPIMINLIPYYIIQGVIFLTVIIMSIIAMRKILITDYVSACDIVSINFIIVLLSKIMIIVLAYNIENYYANDSFRHYDETVKVSLWIWITGVLSLMLCIIGLFLQENIIRKSDKGFTAAALKVSGFYMNKRDFFIINVKNSDFRLAFYVNIGIITKEIFFMKRGI